MGKEVQKTLSRADSQALKTDACHTLILGATTAAPTKPFISCSYNQEVCGREVLNTRYVYVLMYIASSFSHPVLDSFGHLSVSSQCRVLGSCKVQVQLAQAHLTHNYCTGL